MLNAIANQLRFASAHTLFFSSLMLHMFMSAQQDGNVIPERIGRVLLERVLVRRPHPWGLIVTFVELLDNEVYNFWKQPFVRMEHEIFLLFGQAHKNMAPK
jgi:CCR4-NOT transcription complex subunit 1